MPCSEEDRELMYVVLAVHNRVCHGATSPGGDDLALVLVAEIGNVHRVPDAGTRGAYAGLVSVGEALGQLSSFL